MASYIGRVGEFQSDKETFSSYVERMEMFFAANNIVEVEGDGHAAENAAVKKRKKAIFLTEVGPEVYSTLSNLLTPAKPKDTTFEDIVRILEAHYNPEPLEIAESFHFGTRDQQLGESIGNYVVALKKLTIHCNYGEFLNRALRDRFVCGLNNPKIQNKLLNTVELTFEKACKIATAMEMADKNTRELRPTNSSSSSDSGLVNKVQISQSSEKSLKCYRCNGNHFAKDCRFRTAKCYNCQKLGHIASACRLKNKQRGQIQNLETENSDTINYDEEELGIYSLFATRNASNPSRGYTAQFSINGIECEMQIDTAADYSIMSRNVFERKFANTPLNPSTIQLKTYTGELLKTCGEMNCQVVYKNQVAHLPIIIAEYEDKPTLLGRNWLKAFNLDWKNVFSMTSGTSQKTSKQQLDELLLKHSEMFKEGYDGMKGFEAHIRVREDAKPMYFKPRPVPYALKPAIEEELDKLERNGVIVKTEKSEWASPIVVVPKADKSVRICGDYKVTVNQAVEDEQYPLPTTQDLYATLTGAKVFTKLDLSHAYAQLSVDEESQKYLTINTHKGLYSYTKLPYGIKSSPKIFQAKMDQILQGVQKCLCKQDDILIGGSDESENLQILAEVLERLHRHNVRLNLNKCTFLKPEVVYLGLCVNADGLHPVEEKVQAILKAPVPQNVGELRSFLGMVQYYQSFLPGLASTLQPLNELLKKDVPWKWTLERNRAYETCKQCLSSDSLLVHYDTNRELKLACDASSYGVGAVISHVLDNGEERPIAFASRTLSISEKNYAQIEKEALSIIFGVKKFHQFLYGRKFTLVTDHKPLLAILGPKSPIPTLAAARMQRWALVLSAYDYEIEYRNSVNHQNADALSRLPFESSNVGSEGAIYTLGAVGDDFPLKAEDIAEVTHTDPVLSKAYEYTMTGWPKMCTNDDLKPYHNRKNELSCEQGCLLWGIRVIIPSVFRDRMLKEIHWEHPGMSSMKAIARNFVWWPKMNEQIEQLVKSCTVCQNMRNVPPSAPLHPWKWPTRPFQRVHLDFCEKDKDSFLVLIDSYSKWIDVKHMTSTTAERTIDELRTIFADHGLPEEAVSDNGPQFVSAQFKEFMGQNGIKHTLSPPYHPATNGAAERSVRIVKEALQKQVLEGARGMSMKHRLANFLIKYRTTPHSVTGCTPAELMVKRHLRTRLSLVKPNLAEVVENKQAKQKQYHDNTHSERKFQIYDQVRVQNMRASKSNKWVPGFVVKACGPRKYLVKFGNTTTRMVHVDQMIRADDNPLDNEQCISEQEFEYEEPIIIEPADTSDPSVSSPQVQQSRQSIQSSPVCIPPVIRETTHTPQLLRRSERVKKPVIKLNL